MKVQPLVCICLFAAISANPITTKVDYSGYAVVSVFPTTEKAVQLLHILERQGQIEFWKEPTILHRHVSIQVSRNVYEQIRPIFYREAMSPTVLITDIQSLINEREREINERKTLNAGSKAFDLGNFHTYSELIGFIQATVANYSHVSYESIGKTYYGLDIGQATVSSTGDSELKEKIFMECGVHAKEWIGPSTCIWIFDQLANGYGTDPEITALIDKFDWILVPSINPDGYEYSWTTDRLWRKNRVPIDGSTCVGVDMNRNFDANFGGVGSSALPCSDKYHGPEAFSESESAAIRNSLSAHAGLVKAYVSIHSYGGIWMTPYGYSSDLPVEYNEMYRVMKIGAEALTATYGTPVEYSNEGAFDCKKATLALISRNPKSYSSELDLTSGTTRDYAYVGQNITYPYTIESRNKPYGYLAPASEIIPTAEEIWNGLKAMAKAL